MTQHEFLQTAERYLPGACLGMMHLPADIRMVMVRGQGSKIFDAAGKEYLDYMLGSGPLLLGHARPEVVEAVQKQVADGSTFFALNEPAIRLAEKMVQAIPCGERSAFRRPAARRPLRPCGWRGRRRAATRCSSSRAAGTAATTLASCPASRPTRPPFPRPSPTATALPPAAAATCWWLPSTIAARPRADRGAPRGAGRRHRGTAATHLEAGAGLPGKPARQHAEIRHRAGVRRGGDRLSGWPGAAPRSATAWCPTWPVTARRWPAAIHCRQWSARPTC